MKVNNQLLKLIGMIQNAQIIYHITGNGKIAHEYSVSTLYQNGTDVTYRAQRIWNVKGLEFAIYKETTSIAKGSKQKYIGHTNAFGRDYVEII